MTDSKISFSKEIANTIGLEEAILLEHIREEEALGNKVSFEKVCSDITFWSHQIIEDALDKLIKTGLIIESNIEGNVSLLKD